MCGGTLPKKTVEINNRNENQLYPSTFREVLRSFNWALFFRGGVMGPDILSRLAFLRYDFAGPLASAMGEPRLERGATPAGKQAM